MFPGEKIKAAIQSCCQYRNICGGPVRHLRPADAGSLLDFLNQHAQGVLLRSAEIGSREEDGVGEIERLTTRGDAKQETSQPNPKSEGRNPKEIRIPNSENSQPSLAA